MKSRQNTTTVEKIFEESEAIRETEKELNQRLEDIGIDADKLVESGLEKIEKLMNKEDAKIVSMPSEFPIAANKQKADLSSLKQDLLKKNEEDKTPRKK